MDRLNPKFEWSEEVENEHPDIKPVGNHEMIGDPPGDSQAENTEGVDFTDPDSMEGMHRQFCEKITREHESKVAAKLLQNRIEMTDRRIKVHLEMFRQQVLHQEDMNERTSSKLRPTWKEAQSFRENQLDLTEGVAENLEYIKENKIPRALLRNFSEYKSMAFKTLALSPVAPKRKPARELPE